MTSPHSRNVSLVHARIAHLRGIPARNRTWQQKADLLHLERWIEEDHAEEAANLDAVEEFTKTDLWASRIALAVVILAGLFFLGTVLTGSV